MDMWDIEDGSSNEDEDGFEDKPSDRRWIAYAGAAVAVLGVFATFLLLANPGPQIDKTLFKRGDLLTALHAGARDQIANEIGALVYGIGLLTAMRDNTHVADTRCQKMIGELEVEGMTLEALIAGIQQVSDAYSNGRLPPHAVKDAMSAGDAFDDGVADGKTLLDPAGPYGCGSVVTMGVLAGIRGEIPVNAASRH